MFIALAYTGVLYLLIRSRVSMNLRQPAKAALWDPYYDVSIAPETTSRVVEVNYEGGLSGIFHRGKRAMPSSKLISNGNHQAKDFK